MFELTAEAVILLLRLALVALIYLFLASIALAAARELRGLARRASAPGQGRRGGHLVVVQPGATSLTLGEALPLRPVTRLGRASQNTIVLDDTFISAEHAVIVQRDGGWWLTDRGSTNGTAVNDRPVEGEVGLQAGDVVVIGDVRLKVAP
jgi:hypothetical protein